MNKNQHPQIKRNQIKTKTKQPPITINKKNHHCSTIKAQNGMSSLLHQMISNQ
jgi:hypothetical protein